MPPARPWLCHTSAPLIPRPAPGAQRALSKLLAGTDGEAGPAEPGSRRKPVSRTCPTPGPPAGGRWSCPAAAGSSRGARTRAVLAVRAHEPAREAPQEAIPVRTRAAGRSVGVGAKRFFTCRLVPPAAPPRPWRRRGVGWGGVVLEAGVSVPERRVGLSQHGGCLEPPSPRPARETPRCVLDRSCRCLFARLLG